MSLQELTAENFQQLVLEAQVPTMVDFWSAGCGPCRRMLPLLEELARESQGRFNIFKVDVTEEPQLAAAYHVYAVPTMSIFRSGQAAEVLVGYKEKAVLLEALERGESFQRAANS